MASQPQAILNDHSFNILEITSTSLTCYVQCIPRRYLMKMLQLHQMFSVYQPCFTYIHTYNKLGKMHMMQTFTLVSIEILCWECSCFSSLANTTLVSRLGKKRGILLSRLKMLSKYINLSTTCSFLS